MLSKRYGKTTFETEIKLKCDAKRAEDAHMNIKNLNIKLISKINENLWLFVIRHDEKFLDEIKKMKTVEELSIFNDSLNEVA